MANQVEVRNNVTFPVLGILGVAFVLLKVLGIAPVAAWSWWLVTLPFWIGIAIVFGLIAIGTVAAGIGYLVLKVLDR